MGFDTIEPSEDIPQFKTITLTKDQDVLQKVRILCLLMIFGILWFLAFQKAKVGFIAMVSASTYYFDSN